MSENKNSHVGSPEIVNALLIAELPSCGLKSSDNTLIHYKQKVKDIILIGQIWGKYFNTTLVGHSILQGFIAGSENQTKTTIQCTTSMQWVSGSHHP